MKKDLTEKNKLQQCHGHADWCRCSIRIAFAVLFYLTVPGLSRRFARVNPVEAGLSLFLKAYHYSSASFYETGVDHFKMLTHYMG
jgi:hypothetical protein